jgi:hypothetical protein
MHQTVIKKNNKHPYSKKNQKKMYHKSEKANKSLKITNKTQK